MDCLQSTKQGLGTDHSPDRVAEASFNTSKTDSPYFWLLAAPIPGTSRRAPSSIGLALARARKVRSPKTTYGGTPSLAATVLRHSRRRSNSDRSTPSQSAVSALVRRVDLLMAHLLDLLMAHLLDLLMALPWDFLSVKNQLEKILKVWWSLLVFYPTSKTHHLHHHHSRHHRHHNHHRRHR